MTARTFAQWVTLFIATGAAFVLPVLIVAEAWS